MDQELSLTLAYLRDAANLYRELDLARRQASEGARRQASIDALDAEFADDLGEAEDERRRRASAVAALEVELQGLEAKLRDRRARPAADAHTQLALTREMATLRERRDAIEQQLLDLWQENSEADAAADAEAAGVADHRRRLAGARQDAVTRADQADLALPEIEADLQHLLQRIPPRVASRLKRLGERLGDPVADLLQGSCGSCGYTMPPQDAVDVDREARLVVCQGCGRYVVPRSSRKTRNPG